MPATANEDVLIRIRTEIINQKQMMRETQQAVSKYVTGTKRQVAAVNDLATQQQKLVKLNDKLNTAMGKEAPFQGWALSIMFAGMAVKNAMTQIWQSSSRTFNDIMHSVEGNVTAFDKLQGSITYLWFVVGQALEPVAEFLYPIIDAIAEWVSENETLARTLFIISTVFGVVATAVGFMVLAVAGFAQAWALAGPAITGAIKGIAAIISGVGLPVILLIAAAVLALVAMWQTNFGGIKDFTAKIFGSIWNIIKLVFGWVWNTIKDLSELFVAVFNGDWDTALKVFLRILARTWNTVLSLFTEGLTMVTNIFIFAFNLIADIVSNIIIGLQRFMVQKIFDGLDWIIEKIKGMYEKMGKDAPRWLVNTEKFLEKSAKSIDDLYAKTQSFADLIKIDYVTSDTFKKETDMFSINLDRFATGPTQAVEAPQAQNVGQAVNIASVQINGVQNPQDFLNQLQRFTG